MLSDLSRRVGHSSGETAALKVRAPEGASNGLIQGDEGGGHGRGGGEKDWTSDPEATSRGVRGCLTRKGLERAPEGYAETQNQAPGVVHVRLHCRPRDGIRGVHGREQTRRLDCDSEG